jgi:hypothetical protein
MPIRLIFRHYHALLWLGAGLVGIMSCKDFEDCRAVYTNMVYAEIKSSAGNILSIHKVEFLAPYPQVLYDSTSRDEEGRPTLSDLKRLPLPLHPQHTSVELLFYKDPLSDPAPDTLTIFYSVHAGLLSPHCGLHKAYILDSIHTSFAEATIIKPTLRTEDYERGNEEETKNPNVKIRY